MSPLILTLILGIAVDLTKAKGTLSDILGCLNIFSTHGGLIRIFVGIYLTAHIGLAVAFR